MQSQQDRLTLRHRSGSVKSATRVAVGAKVCVLARVSWVSSASRTIRVEAWWLNLDQLLPQPDWCSADELNRAVRMLPQVRSRFLAARTALRYLLSQATQLPPADLVFDYGPQGKPQLSDFPQLEFNLSHSEGLGLLAIAPCPIGVDLEQVMRPHSYIEIAQRFFPATEAHYLATLPPLAQQRAFLRSWVAKEAWLKGTGQGLAGNLSALAFDHHHQRLAGDGSDGWHLEILEPSGAIAAVATPIKTTLTLRQLSQPVWKP